jgi:hypothetical protein
VTDRVPRSWQLKLGRAEQHFADFERALSRYKRSDPYRAELRTVKRRGQPAVWSYVLRVDQPEPELRAELSLQLGDFIHNLRSSLDHLAAALVPSNRRTQSYFPILDRDLWARDAKRRYIVRDPETRKTFERGTRGMDPRAIENIKALQPYRATSRSFVSQHELLIISRLDNADKHSRLIPYVTRLNSAHWLIQLPRREPIRGNHEGPLQDGAELFRLDPAVLGLHSEGDVDVKVYGTPLIAIEVGDQQFRVPINALLVVAGTIGHLRRVVFPSLEPFVRKPSR